MLHRIICTLLCLLFCNNIVFLYAQKVSYENGIKVIENGEDGLWGKNPQLKLEYLGKFGNHNDKDQTTWFTRPSDIAFDQQGNVYVLDADDRIIKKFDRNRKFLYSFGGKGRGPGELIQPDKISVSPNGNIYVSDKVQNRVNIYSNDGKSIGTIKVKYIHFPFIMINDEQMIVSNPILTGAGAPHKPVLFLMDTKGNKLKSFGEGPYPKTGNSKKDGNLAAGNQLTFNIDKYMNSYAVFMFANYIDKIDKEGKTILRIKNGDKPSSKNWGVAVDSKERIWVLTNQRFVRKEEEAGIKSVMYSESEGVINVEYEGDRKLVKTDMYAIELFDKEGRFLCKYPLNHFIRNYSMDPTCFGIKINKNELYVIENMREMTFHIYKISDL